MEGRPQGRPSVFLRARAVEAVAFPLVPPRPPARPPAAASGIRILAVDPPSLPGRDLPRGSVDEWVQVSATFVRHGDERVMGMLRYRSAGSRRWRYAPLYALPGDRFSGSFLPDAPGLWQVQLDAWVNRWDSWRTDVSARVQGVGQADYAAEIAAGRTLLEGYCHFPFVVETLELADAADSQTLQLVTLLTVDALPDQHELVSLPRALVVAVDPEAAASGAWFDLPEEASPALLGRVAAVGFDTALVASGVWLGGEGGAGSADAARARVEALVAAADADGLRLALGVSVGDALATAMAGAGSAAAVDGLGAELLAWIAAGVSSFEVEGAARLPLPVWEAVLGTVLGHAPEAIFSAAGPLRPAFARALGLAGFAQLSTRLDEVPTQAAAELLVQQPTPSLTSPLPRLRLSASGGGALVAAATLSPAFGVVGPDGGALVLARRLADLRRARASLRPGSEIRFVATADDGVLAFLRSTPRDELLVVINRRPHRPLEMSLTLPPQDSPTGAADAGETGDVTGIDLLADGERRLEWHGGACDLKLPPGGALVLRLER